MRDLLFKNLTSIDRKRRVISCCETKEKEGVRTTIRRHFVCKLIELKNMPKKKPLSQVYFRRFYNSAEKQEGFAWRIKASMYAQNKEKLYLVLFCHSLKIDLRPIGQAIQP